MADLSELIGAFSGRILNDPADMEPFLVDWRHLWRGGALAVVQPDSPQDVANVVRWCASNGVPIVPQGGNTGMSGGATPAPASGAILLSLARINRIRAIDPVNNVAVVDAGCILQSLQEEADAQDRYFPLSLGAEGSCTIGGNLATNAGGTAVLRYGTARDLCLGLEVVTAQGELWDGLRGLRKDNSGYDLRDLYIGSEGTLGIITGAVMRLFPKPAGSVTSLVAVSSIEAAVALFDRGRAALDTGLTAFEFLSGDCLQMVLDHRSGMRNPLETLTDWLVLVEVSDPRSEERARAALEQFLGEAFEAEEVVDATIAESVAQSRALWELREGISEAQSAIGKTIKHDIAVPISRVPAFITQTHGAITAQWPDMRFVTFGHLGDGNIHYNFSPVAGGDQAAFYARQDAVNRIVHDTVAAHGGTVSAEHGLGQLRVQEAARFKSPVELDLQRRIKTALDPQGLMNPGKLLP